MSSAYTRMYVRVWRTSIAARCLRQIGRFRSKKRWHGRNRTVLSPDRSSMSVETRHCPSKGGSTFCLLPLRRQLVVLGLLVVLDLSAEACACLSGSSCWDSAAATLIACVKHQSPTSVLPTYILQKYVVHRGAVQKRAFLPPLMLGTFLFALLMERSTMM